MKITPNTLEAYRLFHDGTIALARAERAGMRVDMKYVEAQKILLTARIKETEKKVKDSKLYRHWAHTTRSGAPNLYSTQQLGVFLYKVKKIEPKKFTKTGQGATDEEALMELGIPELTDLIKIRKYKKLRDTYLEGFSKEAVKGFIHPNFNLFSVRTFRSSSDKPNFQNMPKRDPESMRIIRGGLFPRKGHQLLEIDFSGLEVRIAACYHKDKTMLAYLKDGTSDMHGDMAKQLFKLDNFDKHIKEHGYLRAAAKNGFVFPEFYGSYYANCADALACKWGGLPHGAWKADMGVKIPGGHLGGHMIDLGFNSLKKYTNFVKKVETDFWENRFPQYAAWKERHWEEYKKKGELYLLTGFTCGDLMGKNDAINYPVQGAAFHALLWSLIQLDRLIIKNGWRTRIIGQIHDAINLDVYPPELEMVARAAKHITNVELAKAWKWIIVPLDVDAELCPVDGSWAEKEEWNEFKAF